MLDMTNVVLANISECFPINIQQALIKYDGPLTYKMVQVNPVLGMKG